MTRLLETLVNGLSVGSLYALVALGYTMVYGILKFINFAHGDVFMVGAWGAWLLARAAGWAAFGVEPPWWSAPTTLAGAVLICATLGYLIERFAYRPLRGAPRLNILITAIGVSLLLQNVGQMPWVFGTQPARMPPLVAERALFQIAGVHVQMVDVLAMVAMLVLMGLLMGLIYRSRLGLAMRAVSQDSATAALMGVHVNRVISMTFVIGSALAGVGGFLFAMKYSGLNQPAHSTWLLLGLKAFVAAVVGGIGSIQGAVLGGMLIGLLEVFGAAYTRPELRDIYVFAILIAVLLIRPAGLMGKFQPEKV